MLVLTRRKDERIIIGDVDIIITVVETRKDRVKIGITASDNVPVHREEVWKAIQLAREEGLPLAADDVPESRV